MIDKYSMLYSGDSKETRAQSGVALIIDRTRKWTSRITDYSLVNDRIITVASKPTEITEL